MNRFNNLHALVTGGSNGIGLATARRIAQEGGTVLITGRNEGRLTEANKFDGVTAIANDNADPDSAVALRAAVDEHLDGRIDALFLNAGHGAPTPMDMMDADAINRQFDVNVRAPLLQLTALQETLAEGGAVLFNTSVINDLGFPGFGVYAATKGAVRSAMKVVANELAPRNVRVNAVSPGPIETGFFVAAGLSDEEIQGLSEQIQAMVPLGRFGRSEEVAAAAAFLLSSDASYITATELIVDGGIS
ncbi:MAG: SDR family oxidoreductase [Acidimicrobiia bacterium]|nr:SDR family oxidoreductase [Acidimicrobiia bacterium]